MHIPSSGGSNFVAKPAPAGSQPARCLYIIDIGTQTITWQGSTKQVKKMYIGFELVYTNEVFREGEAPRPFVVNKEYTQSLGDTSRLYKDLCSWLGRKMPKEEIDAGYDIKERITKPCAVNIIHSPNKQNSSIVYANVDAIMAPMAGMPELPPLRNVPFHFEIGMPNQFEVFKKIYGWIQKKIAASPEFQAECAKYGVNPQQLMEDAKREWMQANNIQPRNQQQAPTQNWGQQQQPQQGWGQQPAPAQNWQQPASQPGYQQQPPQVQYPAAPNPQYNPPAPNYGQPQYPNQQPQQPGYPQGQPPMQQQPQYQQQAPQQFQQPGAPPAPQWGGDANVYTGQDAGNVDPF